MRLKSKLVAAILLVALSALGIFYFATTGVINRAFDKIEARDIRQHTARAVDALDNRLDQLEFKATDWASWDDTYAFALNNNAAFIKSNLQPGSLKNLGIHYALFFNAKQQLMYSRAIDPSSGNVVPIPQAMLDATKPGSKLLAATPESMSKGVLALPGHTVQMVSLPILTSESTGPVHGTLIFASDITPDVVAELSALTHLSLGYIRIDDPKRPTDLTDAIGSPTSPKSAIKTLSDKEIAGYQTINDVYDRPVLVARVVSPREIHQTADSALSKYLLIIALDTAGAIALVVALMMIVRTRDKTIALKNEFFSIASHELRTPLTVIRNYAQLMRFQFSKQINDPKFDHMADSIDQAGAQLIGVVNVYLDAARLESGKIPFQVQPFALADLASTLGPELTASAKTKNVSVIMDCPNTLPLVLGDKERVQQIILNLFGNAMKFTDSGSITVKGEVVKDKMMVYVTDTGRGMDEGAQSLLFKRFSQVQSKDALRGSGLGLFISKKLVEQMGGSIQVESSAPGIGSTLSFSLPLAPAAPAATPGTTVVPPAPTTPA